MLPQKPRESYSHGQRAVLACKACFAASGSADVKVGDFSDSIYGKICRAITEVRADDEFTYLQYLSTLR